MSPPAPSSAAHQLLAAAIAHHGAGRLAEAEQLYRQLLDADPSDAQVLQLLGTIRLQQGNCPAAIDLMRRAIAAGPDQAEFHVNLGVALVTAGRAEEAIEEYRRAIALRPDLGAAHNHLGLALQARSRLDEAVTAFRQAVAMLPNDARVHYNLARALEAARQFDAAIDSYEQALAIDPRLAECWHNLATVRLARDRDDDAVSAVKALQRSLELRPNHAQTLANLGCAFRQCGHLDAAIDAARRSLELKPDLIDGLVNLSLSLTDVDRLDEAVDAATRAVEIAPDHAGAHLALGYVLLAQNRLSEAIAADERAIALEADNAEAYNNLARALHAANRYGDAIIECRRAIALRSDQAEGYGNLSLLLMESGDLKEAIAVCRRAIADGHDDGVLKWNLAFSLLKSGKIEEGFALHEFRHHAAKPYVPPRAFSQPRWDGSPLGSRTILIHAEQGVGDTIQFVRYVPLVTQRGGKVILDCPVALHQLLASFPNVTALTSLSEPGAAKITPPFDVQCPLMSLPLVFGTTLETIPADVPYLFADAARAAVWKTRIAAVGEGRLNVGVAWAGNPAHKNDRRRSIAPSLLAPLAQIAGVRLFSLQMPAKTGLAVNARSVAAEMGMIDWTAELADFTDTAALVANLDLVICVDTSIAHLAGAMGRPVWMLIPLSSDWRWLSEREDTPWYPTMRLLRQERVADWAGPIDRLVESLRQLSRERST
jgi:tetratricopeptide (TPR) repeat protein